jgi:ADP-dependent NAD(P)H-hydrate dehydratase / NAD(P)H-hydrate epimerase
MLDSPRMRVLNAAQMQEADGYTINEIGLPSIVLMENAGRQVVAAMEGTFEDLESMRVAVVAGRGNNGGDGFVVARTLLQRHVDVAVFLIGKVAEVRGDARLNLEMLGRLGLSAVEIANEQDWELHFSDISDCDLIVDALFGTGLREPLSGMWQTVVADINGSGIPVVSIDLPSGLSADTHELIGDAIEATLTVTLGAPKLPLILPPAERNCGDLVIADIGIPVEVVEGIEGPRVEILTREEMRELIQPRTADSHKGDFGRVVVAGGSRGKTGAAFLTAQGALRSGAGLVTVATPASVLPIVASLAPEYMTEPLPETEDGRVAADAVERVLALEADVIALGPGLGTGPGPREFVYGLVERAGATLVLDADALNAFSDDPDRLQGRDGLDIIITPHPGEMARLLGLPVDEVQKDRIGAARQFATAHGVHVVLKGHRTIVASPEGTVSVNLTGNPGMATGGTGDVLTGMIAAWSGQLLDAEAACRLAVYLHGLAGDLSEADEGEQAMTAGDLLAHLGDAVMELSARRRAVGPARATG